MKNKNLQKKLLNIITMHTRTRKQRHFNVHATSSQRYGRYIDVGTKVASVQKRIKNWVIWD